MAVTPQSFRDQFEAFADPMEYSDAMISVYNTIAIALLNADVWDPNVLDYGTCLFIAHHLVLDRRDAATVAAGGVGGLVQGVLTSKSVDRVSASYDTAAVTMTDGAYWNMTTYGIRFLQLSRYMGAGGIQLGIGCGGPGFFTGVQSQ